jgi:dTDP-4-amino-4,6-dideoxygalactose transaminase
VAATSFYPAKPLGCYGDGGAIFTNDDYLANKCKAIRIHGTTSDRYHSELIGLNGRLDSLQAAVLLEKLTIFDEELDLREKISIQYRNNLRNCQYIPDNYISSHALFSIVFKSDKQRNEIIEELRKNNVPTAVYYKYPIHLMKAFSYLSYKKKDFPVSEKLSKTILSLPMHPYLSPNDVELIVKYIK